MTLITTRSRLQAALDGLHAQDRAAAALEHQGVQGELTRCRADLQAAQNVMAEHLQEVKVILEAARALDTPVPNMTVTDVLGAGVARLERSAV